MGLWTFREYETEQGKNYIGPWYETQTVDVQAAFRDAVIQLGRRPNWKGNPLFKDCKKAHKGLSEIRFPTGARHTASFRRFRLVGICDPLRRDFLFLVGCEKFGGGQTDPEQAFELAQRLKAAFEQGKGTTREHRYD